MSGEDHSCRKDPSPTNCEWDAHDREDAAHRVNSMTLAELRAHIDVRVIRHLQDHEGRVTRSMDKRFDEVVGLIKSAYPNDDPASHRAAHEGLIQTMNARREFFEELRKNLATWGVVGALGFIGIASWTLFISKVKESS